MIEIRRGVIPFWKIDAALRLLHVDIMKHGWDRDALHHCLHSHHFFPHLNHHEDIRALVEYLPDAWRQGTLCDPQILLQFPNVGPIPEITFHTDKEPDWAEGRRYVRIVGVPLSPWRSANGAVIIKDAPGDYRTIRVAPGDALCMSPDQEHSGGVNVSGEIRYGVYFRWLES